MHEPLSHSHSSLILSLMPMDENIGRGSSGRHSKSEKAGVTPVVAHIGRYIAVATATLPWRLG